MLSNFRRAFQGGKMPMVVLMTIILLGLLAYLSPSISYGSSHNSDIVLARVYGRDILRRDVDLIVSGMLKNIGKDVDSKDLIPFLINQAMTKLVRTKLLEELAERNGIFVTDLELKRTLESHLKQYGFVGRDGKLLPSSEINNILLETSGISLKWLENSTSSDLARHKLLKQFAIQVPLDNAWVDSEIRVRNEKIGLEAITIAPNVTRVVDPELSTLERFYGENKARFQVGPRRVIDYVLLTPSSTKMAPIDELVVKASYDSNKDQFTELRASHILFKAVTDSELLKATKRARDVRAKLLAGYNFGKAAETFSQDPSVRTNRGDLGWFQLGRMQKSFERVAMALKIGEISEPVQTSFGVHIIRLEGRRVKDFNQVKEECRDKLIRDRFTMKAKDQLEQLRKRVGKHGNLSSATSKLGLTSQTSRPFLNDAAHSVVDIPGGYDVVKEAFQVKVGAVSQVKHIQEGFLIFKVREERPTSIPPFSEAKADVLTVWLLEEARKVAIDDVKNALRAGDLKVADTPPTIYNDTTIAALGPIGQHPAIRKALLGTPVGQLTPILWTLDGKLWVARIKSRIPVGPFSFSDRRSLVEQIQLGIASNVLNTELDNIEKLGSKRSGLSSIYGRFNGIWYNKKELSAIYNTGVSELQ